MGPLMSGRLGELPGPQFEVVHGTLLEALRKSIEMAIGVVCAGFNRCQLNAAMDRCSATIFRTSSCPASKPICVEALEAPANQYFRNAVHPEETLVIFTWHTARLQ